MADNIDTELVFGPQQLITPDFDDRRRIAVAEFMLHLERNGGSMLPGPFGQIVLHSVTSEDEVIPMSEAMDKSIMSRMGFK